MLLQENNQPSCHACLSRTPANGFCPHRNGADPNVPCICCGTLSQVEEQSNMILWSMFAGPLEIAADIRHVRMHTQLCSGFEIEIKSLLLNFDFVLARPCCPLEIA